MCVTGYAQQDVGYICQFFRAFQVRQILLFSLALDFNFSAVRQGHIAKRPSYIFFISSIDLKRVSRSGLLSFLKRQKSQEVNTVVAKRFASNFWRNVHKE